MIDRGRAEEFAFIPLTMAVPKDIRHGVKAYCGFFLRSPNPVSGPRPSGQVDVVDSRQWRRIRLCLRRQPFFVQSFSKFREFRPQQLITDLAGIVGLMFDELHGFENCDIRNPFAQLLDQSAHDGPRVMRPKAEVPTESEGHTRVRSAVEPDFVRFGKHFGITVGGRPAKRDEPIGLNLEAMHVRLHRTDPPDVCERDEQPEKLLGCQIDLVRICP